MAAGSASSVAWGVISGAQIGLKTVIPAIQASNNSRVVAIGTRHVDRVRESAAALGVPRVYDSYEAVLDDPEVTAVYIPVPNAMHAEWTRRAAQRGKHVLCEKPLALTAAEAEEMIDACRRAGVWLMEAFMYRFHPQHARARHLIADGALGPVRLIRSAFTFALNRADRGNIRLSRELWGGSLMDVGCYCVNSSRWYMGAEPGAVLASADISDEFGVDMTLAAILEFPEGRSQFVSSLDMTSQTQLEIVGERGRLEIPGAFLPGAGDARFRLVRGGRAEEIVVPGVDQYRLEVEHFADCVLRNQAPSLPPEDALANTRVIEALRRAVADGRRVRLTEIP
jgi:D-xylose 1-dehydrogenase (NADP+, D-xylono-1,5-lactone-forming)